MLRADSLNLVFTDTTICLGDSVELLLEKDTILVDQFAFDYTGAIIINSVVADSGEHYFFKISGDFTGAGNAERRDAAYYFKLNWQNVQIPAGAFKWNGVGNNRPFPDIYNPLHVYYFPFIGDGQSQQFTWNDTNYSDNSGSLQVEMYKITGLGVWSTGDTAFNIKVSPSSSTVYYVSAMDGTGPDSIVVNVISASSPLDDSLSQCSLDSIAIGLTDHTSVVWSTHEAGDSIWALYTDPYYVQMVDSNGCTINDTVQVSLMEAYIEQGDTAICAGDSVTFNLLHSMDVPLVYFDGVNDFIQVSHSSDFLFDRDFTISAWVSPDQLVGFQSIINKVTSPAEKQFCLQLKDDSLIFDYEKSSNDFYVIHGGLTPGWHHVAVSVDPGLYVRMYIDGVLVQTVLAPAAPTDLSSDLVIGKLGGTYNTHYFKGLIKDVKIWKRTLSDLEVMQSVCEHPDPFKEEALLSHWMHAQDQANYVWDLTPNNLDGIPYGPVWVTATGPCSSSFNYNWSTGQSSDSVTIGVSQTDTIVLQVSNSQLSCYDSIIVQASIVDINLPDDLKLCESDSVIVQVDSSLASYVWSTSDSTFSIWASSSDSTLILQVFDSLGCDDIDTASIEVFYGPVWQQSDTQLCPGAFVDLSLELPYVYDSILWWSGSQNSIQSFAPSSDTQFYVNLWRGDSNVLCHFIDTFSVIMSSGIGLSDSSLFVCENDSLSLGLSQNFTSYFWSTNATSQTIDVLDTGYYKLSVVDSNTCQDSMFFIVDYFVGSDPISYDSLFLCDLNGAEIYANPQYISYQWNHGGNTAAVPLPSVGQYYLSVTDSNQCDLFDSAFVDLIQSSTSIISYDSLFCKGGYAWMFLLDRQDVDSLVWLGGAQDSFQLNIMHDTVIYLETWKGDSACYIKDSLSLLTTELYLSPSLTNVQCFGESDAFINLNVQGGKGSKYYYWNTGQTSDSLGALSAGNYSVTVWDSLGCYKDSSFVISEPPLFSQQLQKQDIVCPGDSSGVINLNLLGGVKPYVVQWNNGSNDSSLTGLSSGMYSFIVADSNNCILEDSILIYAPPQFAILDIIDHVLCKGQSNAQIQVNVSGGTGAYQYSWSSGNNTSIVPSLSAGSYLLTITDSSLCSFDTSFQVFEPDSLLLVTQLLDEHCNQQDAYIILNTQGGTLPYLYQWSNGSQQDTLSSLSAGQYIVTITDQNSCIRIDTLDILNRPNPNIDFDFNDVCIGQAVLIEGLDTAQVIANWIWDDGNSSLLSGDSIQVVYTDTGAYFVQLIATDSFGCADTVNKTINVYPKPDISLGLDTNWGCDSLCVYFTAENSLDSNSIFYWSFEGHGLDTASSLEYCFNQVGSWDVVLDVVSEYGCVNSVLKPDWVHIYPNPVADFSISQSHVDIINSEIDFWDQSVQAISWLWDFGDGTGDTMPNTAHLYTDTGSHQVKLNVVSQNGCVDSVIKLIYVEGKNIVHMPNAFTPGNDNFNNEFKPVGIWENVSFYKFSIWNRWGEMLFESDDPHLGWDGRCSDQKNGECSQGAYVFNLTYMDMTGKMQYLIGSFMLIRKAKN